MCTVMWSMYESTNGVMVGRGFPGRWCAPCFVFCAVLLVCSLHFDSLRVVVFHYILFQVQHKKR